MKISILTGGMLDYWVARAEKIETAQINNGCCFIGVEGEYLYSPSTRWADGGPIIEKSLISLSYNPIDAPGVLGTWEAYFRANDGPSYESDMPLQAAMQCRVAMYFGDEVDGFSQSTAIEMKVTFNNIPMNKILDQVTVWGFSRGVVKNLSTPFMDEYYSDTPERVGETIKHINRLTFPCSMQISKSKTLEGWRILLDEFGAEWSEKYFILDDDLRKSV